VVCKEADCHGKNGGHRVRWHTQQLSVNRAIACR
jgi:hypothetical protein